MNDVENKIEIINENIQKEIKLSLLFKKGIDTHPNYDNLLTELIGDISKLGGGYLITNVSNKVYIELLEKSLNSSKSSIKATLTLVHKPSWFYDKYDTGFPSAQRIEYLKKVNNPKDGVNALRIILMTLDELMDDFRQLGDKVIDQNRPDKVIQFFELHKNVTLFLFDPNDIGNLTTELIPKNCLEDYVIFDDFLIIKRIPQSNSINVLLATHDRNSDYKKIFDEQVMHQFRQYYIDEKQIIQKVIANCTSTWTTAQTARLNKLI